jgi:hypothetical protein
MRVVEARYGYNSEGNKNRWVRREEQMKKKEREEKPNPTSSPQTVVAGRPNCCIPFLRSLATPGTQSPSRIAASSFNNVEKAS